MNQPHINKPKANHIYFWAFLALIVGAVGIGFAPIFMRYSDTGPLSSAFWRIFLSLPILLFLNSLFPDKEIKVKANISDYIMMLALGVMFAFDMALWHLSLVYTTVANATLLNNCAPIIVALSAWLIFKERLKKLFWAALTVAMLGAFLLISGHFHFGFLSLRGDLLALSSALCYGSYMIALNILRRKFSVLQIMIKSTISCSAVLFLFTLIFENNFHINSDAGIMAIFGLAIISQVLGQGLIAFGFAYIPPTISSITLLTQPIIATIAAWVLFHETLNPVQIVGVSLVIGAIYFAKHHAHHKH